MAGNAAKIVNSSHKFILAISINAIINIARINRKISLPKRYLLLHNLSEGIDCSRSLNINNSFFTISEISIFGTYTY